MPVFKKISLNNGRIGNQGQRKRKSFQLKVKGVLLISIILSTINKNIELLKQL